MRIIMLIAYTLAVGVALKPAKGISLAENCKLPSYEKSDMCILQIYINPCKTLALSLSRWRLLLHIANSGH